MKIRHASKISAVRCVRSLQLQPICSSLRIGLPADHFVGTSLCYCVCKNWIDIPDKSSNLLSDITVAFLKFKIIVLALVFVLG